MQMGVQDLMSILRSKAPQVLKPRPNQVFHEVWVDTPLLIMAAYMRSQRDAVMPFAAVEESLQEVARAALPLCTGVVHFVFDGKTRGEKRKTVQKRGVAQDKRNTQLEIKTERDELQMDLRKAQQIVDKKVKDQAMAAVAVTPPSPSPPPAAPCPANSFLLFPDTRTVRVYAQGLLETMAAKDARIRVHHAEHDSEEFIARSASKADVVVSIDSDSLAFGASHVVHHLGRSEETWIQLDNVLEALQLTQSQFRWLCVLLGNDFNTRLRGCGPVTALALVRNPAWLFREWAREKQAEEEWILAAERSYEIFSHRS